MGKLIKVGLVIASLYGILVFVSSAYRQQLLAERHHDEWCHNIDEQLRVISMPPVEQPGRIAQLEEQRSILNCPKEN